jgi:SAM-dependent methyltransferase
MNDDASPELLAQWFETAKGRQFITAEMALIEKSVARLFGAHCAISSLYSFGNLINTVPCRRVYELVSPSIRQRELEKSVAKPIITPICRLPFADESLDCFILLHTLDFVTNPHDAIREVARVVRPGGQVILVGFNPASLFAWSRFVPGMRQQAPTDARYIGRHRLCDWLALLHFEVEYIGGAGLFPFRKEVQQEPEPRKLGAQGSVWKAARVDIGKAFRERYGGVYCIRVRKSSMAGTLVGPERRTQRPVWAPLGSGVAVSQVESSKSKPSQ